MSKISELIFKGAEHKLSSPYGKRSVISTSAGGTALFHYGADYSTGGKKLPQYAIEEGEIISCGKDSAANGYALFVWVKYPRINKKFLHYHLDSICVKKGQKVKKGTLLGYTGMTGKATGIHLHLGVKDLSTNAYEDPEKFAKTYVRADLFVTAKTVNVREGHGKKYDLIGKIGKGTKLEVSETYYNKGSDAKWGYVPKFKGWVNLGSCKAV